MRNFTMDGKVIFQDKASPELKSLIDTIHKVEEEQYFKLIHSPVGRPWADFSDANLTDAEFALILRVKCRLRKRAKEEEE